MFKILLIFAAAIAASHGDPLTSRQRNIFPSTFSLYTNESPNVGQRILLTTASVSALRINSSTNCAIIFHGRRETGLSAMSTTVRDALFTSGTVNVIVVDWSQEANDDFPESAINEVALEVVELIRLLIVNNKINQARLHLIGFELGAHLAGLVGRASTYTIARITGLNPDRALQGNANALRRTDANYVEIIHTETTEFGMANAVGDVDFYPHGGNDQPGCVAAEANAAADTACSHNRAWELFAASLTHGRIIGNKCPSPRDAMSDEPCIGFTLALGTNDMVKYGSGAFRLETTEVYPYRCLVKCGLVDSIIEAIENLGKPDTGP
ncbi:pancreatic triacylglycerol lipase-like [Hyposmocoma kahamanoa]|uniref:pancreatic triacylglycerol lipase-like n=1 Tax=Hyposmocoma kahamanoa TaxID=1477025 RepID=UPI000E6D7614|nr:pancreatic triacylglycerol lipase-like [Hyposmocoma kahamanoa]